MHSASHRTTAIYISSLIALLALFTAPWQLDAQAVAQGLTHSPVEFTVGYATGTSNISGARLSGVKADVEFNVFRHFSVEPSFQRLSAPNHSLTLSAFQVAAKAKWSIGLVTPFAKVIAGPSFISDANPPPTDGMSANTTIVGAGAGMEINLPRDFAVKGSYEYEKWISNVAFSTGLTAKTGEIGLVYRIPSWFGR